MSTRFDILPTRLDGLKVLRRKSLSDTRGCLERLFCAAELRELTRGKHLAQINRTFTSMRGTVRGLHFQRPPHAEIKFVSCLRGEVFDVAVDLRRSSESFLQWHAELLSEGDQKTVVIPEGFAHGFQAISDDCEMLYFHTAAHDPEAEDGLNAQDPRLAIHWPLPVVGLSARDMGHRLLVPGYTGVTL